MKCRFFLSVCLFLLAGCASHDVEVAKSARTSLLGLSELQLETCLGLPDQKATAGKTAIFTYYTNSTRAMSVTFPIINVVGASFNGYCHATFVFEKDRVTAIHYTGDTDDPIGDGKDAACAPIVRACLEERAQR